MSSSKTTVIEIPVDTSYKINHKVTPFSAPGKHLLPNGKNNNSLNDKGVFTTTKEGDMYSIVTDNVELFNHGAFDCTTPYVCNYCGASKEGVAVNMPIRYTFTEDGVYEFDVIDRYCSFNCMIGRIYRSYCGATLFQHLRRAKLLFDCMWGVVDGLDVRTFLPVYRDFRLLDINGGPLDETSYWSDITVYSYPPESRMDIAIKVAKNHYVKLASKQLAKFESTDEEASPILFRCHYCRVNQHTTPVINELDTSSTNGHNVSSMYCSGNCYLADIKERYTGNNLTKQVLHLKSKRGTTMRSSNDTGELEPVADWRLLVNNGGILYYNDYWSTNKYIVNGSPLTQL